MSICAVVHGRWQEGGKGALPPRDVTGLPPSRWNSAEARAVVLCSILASPPDMTNEVPL